ncbi:MAG TPA: hypothetical protein VLC48_01410, partial [Gemmatimonadota bacterium]|nr:hypothetical protein [Gemmatimonadota bacterium]
ATVPRAPETEDRKMTSGQVRAMSRSVLALAIGLAALTLAVGCSTDDPSGLPDHAIMLGKGPVLPHVTGSVEIDFPGGRGHGVDPEAVKHAVAEFEAFPATDQFPEPRGVFFYRVYNVFDGVWTLHREIEAKVTGVVIGIQDGKQKAWLTGVVVEDRRFCSGGGEGDECGCGDSSGGGGHDGGCNHDDTGGCSGGGSGGTGGSDGGCGGDDGGGCSGGGSGGECSGGGTQPGRLSRIGQTIAVKMHDGGTPGADNDGITWKWFAESYACTPQIEDFASWCKLCKKEIVEGNLVIHIPPGE